MKTCTCDLCKKNIKSKTGVCFPVGVVNFDFCDSCVKIVRRAICLKCEGKGRHQEVDFEASQRGASCGENRTEYRTVACQECIGSK